MFSINDRAPDPNPELLKLLAQAEPATIGHFRHHGFMDPSLRPVTIAGRIAGPAVTVRTAGADSTVVHKVMEIVKPGDVVVIDRCGDRTHACWGGLVTLAAHLKGVAAGIVDGPVTDTDEITELDFTLYCRGASALTTKLLGFGGEINTVVQCGGVTVHPGDLVIADNNGIVVLGPEEARETASRAIAMQEEELKLAARLKAGASLPALTRASDIIAATA